MESNITEQYQIKLQEIKDNSKDDHWSKKYEVSAQELNEAGNDLGISAKIIKVGQKNKAFALQN